MVFFWALTEFTDCSFLHKPLPLPPPPSPPPAAMNEDLEAAASAVESSAAVELFPSPPGELSSAGPISASHSTPHAKYGWGHSPTHSYSSSSSSSHHSYGQQRSRVSLSYATHLPIGVGHSHVPRHAHARTMSGKSPTPFSTTAGSDTAPNGFEPSDTHNVPSRRLSRTSFTSFSPGASATRMTETSASVRSPSLLKPLPLLGDVEGHTGQTDAQKRAENILTAKAVQEVASSTSSPVAMTADSNAGYVAVGTSTRTRSRSNAMMPTSPVQFHLPTSMLHKSQSHAQLRVGGGLTTALAPVASSLAQVHVPVQGQVSITASQLQTHPSLSSKSSLVSLLATTTGVMQRVLRRPSKVVLSPNTSITPVRSRTHSNSPSYASRASIAMFNDMQEEGRAEDTPGRSHLKKSSLGQKSQILDSRVPSLSSASSRNAVYIDSDDLNFKLDELLLLAKADMERRAEDGEDEEDFDESEEGDKTVECVNRSGENKEEQWVAGLSRSGDGWVSTQLRSPPNTPVTGYFGSPASVPAQTVDVKTDSSEGESYVSRSSQVYVGSNTTPLTHSREGLNEKEVSYSVEGVARTAETTKRLTPPIRPPPAPPLNMVNVQFGKAGAPVELISKMDMLEPLGIRNESRPLQTVDQQLEREDSEEEDEEMLDEVLAFARELAVDDRMVWGRRSLEMYEDDGGELEDEEMGVGMVGLGGIPRRSERMSGGTGPYGRYLSVGGRGDAGVEMRSQENFKDGEEGHVRFCFTGDDHDGRVVPPSMSKWSLTSSIDDEKRLSAESKPKKEKRRRSFVPFVISGDKDKDRDSKEEGTWSKESAGLNKKRSRLASFISRLSSVGLGGGSGANTPPLETPPIPSGSTQASPSLLPSPVIAPKSDNSPLQQFTPAVSMPPSRSPSPPVDRELRLGQPQIQQRQAPGLAAEVESDVATTAPVQSVAESSAAANASPVVPPAFPSGLDVQTLKTTQKSFSKPRHLPPGLVIPPVPTRPVPTPPGVSPSVSVPLSKAASEGLIVADKAGTPIPLRARSSSSRDVRNNFTLPASTSVRVTTSENSTKKLELPTWNSRRPTLTKSASSSVLALNKHVLTSGPFFNVDTAACYFYDPEQGGNVPPTPTSIASMDDYEGRRREDHDNGPFDKKKKKIQASQPGFQTDPVSHPRLRGMSSLVALSPKPPTPAAPQSKGGLKGLVGRITGRAGNNKVAVVIPSSGEGSENHETLTPGTVNSYKTPTLVHSPRTSLSTVTGSGPSNGGGFLSSLTTYLERTSQRQ